MYSAKILLITSITLLTVASAVAEEGLDPVVIHAPSGANLRTSANVQSESKDVIDDGERVLVIGKMIGNWVPVKVDGQTGYIYKDLLKDTKTGRTLDRATEAGVICTTGDCLNSRKTAQEINRESIHRVAKKITHKKPKHEEEEEDDTVPKATKMSSKGPLPHAQAIENALSAGRTAPRNYCALAVWRILLKAHLVKGSWGSSGADAKYMGPILRRNGFVSSSAVCNRPGAVRIYDGNHCGHGFAHPMVGDRVGHIEILGTDRQYHSFFHSSESITQHLGKTSGCMQRRPLQSCWYKP